MQNLNKKITCDENHNGGVEAALKQKERHIVSWSQEEDDILRQQISINGTHNWTIIASHFKDKTTRQCRRRWFTYLNSDFKKGGWSPEEDMLLCEAQRIYGNRWTEIAKVVSGRTDNAVKNRFSTLCKKRAKHEASAKESVNVSYLNKKTMFHDQPTPLSSIKIRRKHITGMMAGNSTKQLARSPLAVLAHNIQDSTTHFHDRYNDVPKDGSCKTEQGTFLKKGDPKIVAALMQQEQLLSSLALKVHADQSYENACKVIENFLRRTKGSEEIQFDIGDADFQLKDLVDDLRSSNGGTQQYRRQPEGSPDRSEYSTGSTILSQLNEPNLDVDGLCEIEQQASNIVRDVNVITSDATISRDVLPASDVDALPSSEFDSPVQVTPLFRSMAAGIPSPQFSESERHFLMKTLGVELRGSSTSKSQHPPCKRALLHCL